MYSSPHTPRGCRKNILIGLAMSKRKKTVVTNGEEKRVKKETVIKLLALILLTAGIFAVYRITMQFKYFEVVFWTYLVSLTGLIVTYIIYNRAFQRKNITLDMLPDEWSYEEKCEFIEDGERRLKRSSWMLMLIIAFIFTFAFDMLELWVLPWLESILS